jgi:hypothetical protein
VSIRQPGRPEIVIGAPEGRTYRDLNNAFTMDFGLLHRWRAKHAPGMQIVIES